MVTDKTTERVLWLKALFYLPNVQGNLLRFFHYMMYCYKCPAIVWVYSSSVSSLPLLVLIGPPLRAKTSFNVQPSAMLQTEL